MRVYEYDVPVSRSDMARVEHGLLARVRRGFAVSSVGGFVLRDSWAVFVSCSTHDWGTLNVHCERLKATDDLTGTSWAYHQAMVRFFKNVEATPDFMFVLGGGLDEGVGLACRVGLLLDLPTVAVMDNVEEKSGVQWNRQRGSYVHVLADNGGPTRSCVYTLDGAPPVGVSVGHRVSLEEAVSWTLRTTLSHRLPHPLAKALKL